MTNNIDKEGVVNDISILSIYKYIKNDQVVSINDVMIKCQSVERERLLFYVKHLHLFLCQDITVPTPEWLSFEQHSDYKEQHFKYFDISNKLQEAVTLMLNEIKRDTTTDTNQYNSLLNDIPTLLETLKTLPSLLFSNNGLLLELIDKYQTIMTANEVCNFIQYSDNITRCKELLNTLNYETYKNEFDSPSNNTLKKYFIYYIYYLTNKPVFSFPHLCINTLHIVLMLLDMKSNIHIRPRKEVDDTLESFKNEFLSKLKMSDIYINLFLIPLNVMLHQKYDYFSLYTLIQTRSIKYSPTDNETGIIYKLIVFLKNSKVHNQIKQVLPIFNLKDNNVILNSLNCDKLTSTMRSFVSTNRSKMSKVNVDIMNWSIEQFGGNSFIFPTVLFAKYPKELLAHQLFNIIKSVEGFNTVMKVNNMSADKILDTILHILNNIYSTPILNLDFINEMIHNYCSNQTTLTTIVDVFNSMYSKQIKQSNEDDVDDELFIKDRSKLN
ncbi:MAG: hypothetical protein [Cotesia congregata filamentous virus 2]